MSTSQAAVEYVRANKKTLIAQLVDLNVYTPVENPFTIFMAGSPGAGKTEFSKSLLKELQMKSPGLKVVRLDTDELRELLPQYNKTNSDEVQKAATLLFDKIFDYIQEKRLNAIIDTTFASPNSQKNIRRALGRGRKVGILYLYQDPLVAWDYTKKREKLEGRMVPKHVFIRAYFDAKKNVNAVKEKFGNQVELSLFEKDEQNNFVKKAKFNIPTLAGYLNEKYTVGTLEKVLPNRI